MDAVNIRRRYDELYSARTLLDSILDDIQKYVVPYRGDFFKPQDTESEIDWRKRGIYDSTAPIAADLLASSIHSNLTSPMIPWFSLRFRNDALNDIQENKEWIEAVQDQIWQTLKESDFNMEIAEVYLDLVSFGTAILFMEELKDNDWDGITFTACPIRRSYFEYGADDQVISMFRLLQYTKAQIQDKWPDKKDLWENLADDVDTKHDIVFAVYRRDEIKDTDVRRVMKPEKRPWAYKYVMHDSGQEIEEGGYYNRPMNVVRWKKVSGSRWGHSPAFVALSDIKQLNSVVEMSSEAIAKQIDPPIASTERGIIGDLDVSAGGQTQVMSMDEFGPLLPPTSLVPQQWEIERLTQSIQSTFYVDKLELKESPAMTATEVLARLDKQQRQFAPTLGRLEFDLLDPVIEGVYEILERNRQLPPPPEGLALADMDIEYTGPIPRSMRNEEAQGTSLWIGELAGLAQVQPEVLDVPDWDAMAKGLGYARGVPAEYMKTEAEIAAIRDQRAQAMQEQREMEMATQAASAAKDLSAAQDETIQ